MGIEDVTLSTIMNITIPGSVLVLIVVMFKSQLAAWKDSADKQLLQFEKSTTIQIDERKREFDQLWKLQERSVEALEMHASQMVRINDQLSTIKTTLDVHHNTTTRRGDH